ncbi:MBL fold metallo-hydrolase [Rhodanobacter sp. DHB23]|uniref:MBL fold metallo-hydrolase n=1 Tax=Rhodanobacter sp. DHB23 TaxID=2775923 RepID=UPI0017838731|nr:MBL fold metallo-hydrolase [Rhodanobacter sp. DHB23]MBD8873314.1 MBL fold metallo-hydrolase [Rhodanobacter sp. DHB23]
MPVDVASFFHAATSTWTHVAGDAATGAAAVVDPVLDFDPVAGRIGTGPAQAVLDHLRAHGLDLRWILETHAHADHLTAAAWLRARTGAPVAVGAGIVEVQAGFKQRLGLGGEFVADGSHFDRLLRDGDTLPLGGSTIEVLATPGHTADSMSYRVGDAVFIGDTLFSPAAGSARCDFPGGSAAALHASVRRLYALPDDTQLYLCHDYPPAGAAPRDRVPLREQREHNVHLAAGTGAADFVALRERRDATLAVPRLFWPALQVNIRAGELPPADDEGRRFLKLPLDADALAAKP